ncbi:unnamed protein product, partial [Meganyctiphanes norvegica]
KKPKKSSPLVRSSSGYLVPVGTQPGIKPVRSGFPRDSLHIYEEINEQAIANIMSGQITYSQGKKGQADNYNVERSMQADEYDPSEYIDFLNIDPGKPCMDSSEAEVSSTTSGSICTDDGTENDSEKD